MVLFGSEINQMSIHLSVPGGMVVGLAVFIVCMVLFFRQMRAGKLFLLALLFIYCGALVALTQRIVLPAGWHISLNGFILAVKNIVYVPFEASMRLLHNSTSAFIRLAGGNFIMLMPLGVLVPLINPKFRLVRTALLGALVSLSIEGLQFLGNVLGGASIRTVEIDDFIFNTAGCIFAYLVFSLFRRKKGRVR